MFQSWCLCGRCGCFRARVVSMQTKRPTWLALMLCPKTALSTNCSNHSVTIPQNWAAHRWSSGAAGAETKQRHHHFSSNCQVVEQVVGFKQFRTELDSCSSFTQHSVDPVLIPSAAGGSTAPPAAEETQQGLSDWFIGHSLFLPSPSAVYPDVSSTIKHRAKRTRITNQAGKINDSPPNMNCPNALWPRHPPRSLGASLTSSTSCCHQAESHQPRKPPTNSPLFHLQQPFRTPWHRRCRCIFVGCLST